MDSPGLPLLRSSKSLILVGHPPVKWHQYTIGDWKVPGLPRYVLWLYRVQSLRPWGLGGAVLPCLDLSAIICSMLLASGMHLWRRRLAAGCRHFLQALPRMHSPVVQEGDYTHGMGHTGPEEGQGGSHQEPIIGVVCIARAQAACNPDALLLNGYVAHPQGINDRGHPNLSRPVANEDGGVLAVCLLPSNASEREREREDRRSSLKFQAMQGDLTKVHGVAV